MGTPLEDVYKYFLARIETDEWVNEEDLDIFEQDWRIILDMARFYFRYPRKSIEINDEENCFIEKLDNDEIQVLAILMKKEWIKRCIANMDNIRMHYNERDWEMSSSANHLDKLIKLQDTVDREAKEAVSLYGRSINYKPTPFGLLVGKQ